MELEPITLNEHWWAVMLRSIVRHHKFRHENQVPSVIKIVEIEEFDGIMVEFVPQVKEVDTTTDDWIEKYGLCVVCKKKHFDDDPLMTVGDTIVHFLCKEKLEALDDPSGQVGTSGDNRPDESSSPSDSGATEPERAE